MPSPSGNPDVCRSGGVIKDAGSGRCSGVIGTSGRSCVSVSASIGSGTVRPFSSVSSCTSRDGISRLGGGVGEPSSSWLSILAAMSARLSPVASSTASSFAKAAMSNLSNDGVEGNSRARRLSERLVRGVPCMRSRAWSSSIAPTSV